MFAFAGCAINTAGTGYKLLATDGQLASATSAPFDVGTGPANHIAFTTEPSNAIGGSPFVSQPVVAILDAGNNRVAADTHAITLTVLSGPGTLSGCSATTTAGVATFSGCAINTVGTYTLTATDAADNLERNEVPPSASAPACRASLHSAPILPVPQVGPLLRPNPSSRLRMPGATR